MKHNIGLYESFAAGAFAVLLLFAAIAAATGTILGMLRPLIGAMMTAAILSTTLLLVSAWVWFTNPVPNNKANDNDKRD